MESLVGFGLGWNPQPWNCESDALPSELPCHIIIYYGRWSIAIDHPGYGYGHMAMVQRIYSKIEKKKFFFCEAVSDIND